MSRKARLSAAQTPPAARSREPRPPARPAVCGKLARIKTAPARRAEPRRRRSGERFRARRTRQSPPVRRAGRRRRPAHANRSRAARPDTCDKPACVRHPPHVAPNGDDGTRSDSRRGRPHEARLSVALAPPASPSRDPPARRAPRPRATSRRAERFQARATRNACPSRWPPSAARSREPHARRAAGTRANPACFRLRPHGCRGCCDRPPASGAPRTHRCFVR
jgi:hypothetical protein